MISLYISRIFRILLLAFTCSGSDAQEEDLWPSSKSIQSLIESPLGLIVNADGKLDHMVSLADVATTRDTERRFLFYNIAVSEALRKKTDSEYKNILEVLAYGLSDPKVGDWVIDMLEKLRLEHGDFTEIAANYVLQYNYDDGYKSDYIRVLGAAGLNDPRVDFDAVIHSFSTPAEKARQVRDGPVNVFDGFYYQSPAWSALLVLGRNGDKQALSRVLEQARSLSIKELLGHPEIFSDVGYLRQPESVVFLVEYLFSNEGRPGSESYSQSGCALFAPLAELALEGLIGSIESYPFEYRPQLIIWDDVLAARSYIKLIGVDPFVERAFRVDQRNQLGAELKTGRAKDAIP